MRILLGLILGLAVAAGVVWYFADKRGDPNAREATAKVQAMAQEAKTAIQEKLGTPDEIREEFSKTGKVIRRKAREAGAALADATADARITTSIKARILTSPELPALGISVNTTAGRVTLSGSVGTAELVAKAMQLALDTEGVQEVVSTIQVK